MIQESCAIYCENGKHEKVSSMVFPRKKSLDWPEISLV